MNTRSLLISAAIAGTLSALLSAIPGLSIVNCLLCGWLWLAGVGAVWLYGYLSEQQAERGQAAMIGLITGLIGALVATLISAIFSTSAAPIPAGQMQQMEQLLGSDTARMLLAPSTSILIGLIFNLIFHTLFGVIGAFLGTAIFKPRLKPVVETNTSDPV